MKRINKKEFNPDESYETHFPWEDVKACMNMTLNGNKFKNRESCTKCELESENLIWINFKSPKWTWEHLCGRQGPLSICPNCKIQVEFILEILN